MATIGSLVFTRGVNDRIAESTDFAAAVMRSIQRYFARDWGELDPRDAKQNDAAVKAWDEHDEKNYNRVLASYNTEHTGNGDKSIWIIEEWDRSAITVLFPHEY